MPRSHAHATTDPQVRARRRRIGGGRSAAAGRDVPPRPAPARGSDGAEDGVRRWPGAGRSGSGTEPAAQLRTRVARPLVQLDGEVTSRLGKALLERCDRRLDLLDQRLHALVDGREHARHLVAHGGQPTVGVAARLGQARLELAPLHLQALEAQHPCADGHVRGVACPARELARRLGGVEVGGGERSVEAGHGSSCVRAAGCGASMQVYTE